MGISNEPQQVPVSEPIPFFLGPLRDPRPFLFSSSASIHLLGQDFLKKYYAGIFSKKEEIILEFDSSHQSNQSGELNDLLTLFICSVSDSRADSGNTDNLSILN